MGLIFALQPDLRKSSATQLSLCSSKKRFSLGGSFVFGAALLGTMYLAASPLFKVLWNEGNFFDQFLAAFFYAPIVLYPFLTVLCWFFEEVVVLKKSSEAPLRFELTAYEKFFSLKWKKRHASNVSLDDLKIENWRGSINVASLSEKPGPQKRYATKGHWILRYRSGDQTFDLERRAKKEEIDFLKAQIESFFTPVHLDSAQS